MHVEASKIQISPPHCESVSIKLPKKERKGNRNVKHLFWPRTKNINYRKIQIRTFGKIHVAKKHTQNINIYTHNKREWNVPRI